ncbi:MAG: NUDIX hydrolase [Ktedonobacteraceae bacterium]
MFPWLTQNIQDELNQLAKTYGQPVVQVANLEISNLFDPLNKTDRYGEVCMVVRRPNGKVLTMIKTFYPQGAYRLPTGGISHGEGVLAALLRETAEETGLQVKVRRFLAAVAYRTSITGEEPVFYTFAFLLDELGGTLTVLDESEQIADFREVEPANLLKVAEYLEQLGTEYSQYLHGEIRDWGRFRAVIHRAVWQAMCG